MAGQSIPVRSPEQLAALPVLADYFDVGQETSVLITRMRFPVPNGEEPSLQPLVGDILRRTCRLGATIGTEVCKSLCQAPTEYSNELRDCSDLNLAGGMKELGVEPKNVLMVGVIKDNIGFYDQLDEYRNDKDEKIVAQNSLGFRELPGFNAFFARESEGIVLGARLADCGFVAVEMDDQNNQKVRGFVHLTRPNMQGESALAFKVGEEPAGAFEYYLHEAIEHYGAELSSVKAHVVAAIKAEHFVHEFKETDGNRPEDRFPGWFKMGMLENHTNPYWQPSDRIDPDDQWYPQYREMVMWQIKRSGLDNEQISFQDCIDPGDLELGHASNHHGSHGKIPDARDAYLVLPKRAMV